jgi:hypothetical protein
MLIYKKHLVFIFLATGYIFISIIATFHNASMPYLRGIPIFIFCAWLACYAKGKPVPYDIERYPYRIIYVIIGVTGMLFLVMRRIVMM